MQKNCNKKQDDFCHCSQILNCNGLLRLKYRYLFVRSRYFPPSRRKTNLQRSNCAMFSRSANTTAGLQPQVIRPIG